MLHFLVTWSIKSICNLCIRRALKSNTTRSVRSNYVAGRRYRLRFPFYFSARITSYSDINFLHYRFPIVYTIAQNGRHKKFHRAVDSDPGSDPAINNPWFSRTTYRTTQALCLTVGRNCPRYLFWNDLRSDENCALLSSLLSGMAFLKTLLQSQSLERFYLPGWVPGETMECLPLFITEGTASGGGGTRARRERLRRRPPLHQMKMPPLRFRWW